MGMGIKGIMAKKGKNNNINRGNYDNKRKEK